MVGKLKIEIERDAHDDDEFIVLTEYEDKTMGKCDYCGRGLKGSTILGRFHDRKELMVYLTEKIKQLSR